MKKLNIQKNILLFYVCTSLFELFRSSFYGIGTIFLSGTLGLTNLEISLVRLFNPLTIILAEIPSGMIADRYGRKTSFLISLVLSAIGFTIYATASNFSQAVVAEIFYSLGLAFQTGSLEALIISQMNSQALSHKISRLISIDYALRSLGILIGGSIGIFFSYQNIRFAWAFGAIGFIFLSFITLFIDGTKTSTQTKHNFFQGMHEIFGNKQILALLLIGAGITFVNVPFFNYWQIFMDHELGMKRDSFLFFATYVNYNLLMALGGIMLPLFNRLLGILNTLVIVSILVATSSILMAISPTLVIGLLLFLFSEFARGAFTPAFELKFNQSIDDKNRSLYLSKKSLFMRIVMVIAYSLTGFLSAYFNMKTNLIIVPTIGLIIILLGNYNLIKAMNNNS